MEEEAGRQRQTRQRWGKGGKKKKQEILTDPIKYFFVQPPEPRHSQKAMVMRQLLLLVPLKRYSGRHKREPQHRLADFCLKHTDI